MFTALHAAIGLEPGLDLGFEHVEQAVAEQVREVARLDWKRTLPLVSDPSADKNKQREELAKDLAAMANSGGGTIVYGVAEAKVDGIPWLTRSAQSALSQKRSNNESAKWLALASHHH